MLDRNRPSSPIPLPLFDGGGFTVSHFLPTGLTIVVDGHLRRRDRGSSFPLDAEQVAVLRRAMALEVAFATRQAARTASEFKRLPTSQDYVDGMSPKVGLRNIYQAGGELHVQTRPVSYPVYTHLSVR